MPQDDTTSNGEASEGNKNNRHKLFALLFHAFFHGKSSTPTDRQPARDNKATWRSISAGWRQGQREPIEQNRKQAEGAPLFGPPAKATAALFPHPIFGAITSRPFHLAGLDGELAQPGVVPQLPRGERRRVAIGQPQGQQRVVGLHLPSQADGQRWRPEERTHQRFNT